MEFLPNMGTLGPAKMALHSHATLTIFPSLARSAPRRWTAPFGWTKERPDKRVVSHENCCQKRCQIGFINIAI